MKRLPAIVLLAAGACASVDPRSTLPDVQKLVEPQVGKLHWDQGTEADAKAADRVRAILAQPLKMESAIELAVLRNRGLQALYEELGVAQAELVQAGLLKNPSLTARVHFPLNNTGTELGISISQDFLDVFTQPLRKRVAGLQLEQAKVRVAGAVLDTAAEVRTAFITAQAAQQMVEMQRTVLEARQAGADLSERLHRAGNIPDLSLLGEINSLEQARIDLARSELASMGARERLTRLLGLFGVETEWKIDDPLPEMAKDDLPLVHAESAAIAQRLDLRAALAEVTTLSESLSLAGSTRYLPAVEIGASLERDPEGPRNLGPDLRIDLPLFDQGQARIGRLEAQLRLARQRAADLAIAIRSEVRTVRSRLVHARAVIDRYRMIVLPLRERLVALQQQQYNAMQMGLPQLLQVRQQQVAGYQEYIEAVRDYWIARSDLERIIGPRPASPAKS